MNINEKGQVVRHDWTGYKALFATCTSFAGKAANGGSKWNMLCKCGNPYVVWAETLKRGQGNSCGCMKGSLISKSKTIHGHAGHSVKSVEYRAWSGMIQRCTNPNVECYPRYGGRGITVCDRWKNSFVDFLADMGLKPEGMYSVDRIGNDGNYEPGNCHWGTQEEQDNNKSTSKFLTHPTTGETLTYSQWAKKLGLEKSTIRKRVEKKWPIEKILSADKF